MSVEEKLLDLLGRSPKKTRGLACGLGVSCMEVNVMCSDLQARGVIEFRYGLWSFPAQRAWKDTSPFPKPWWETKRGFYW